MATRIREKLDALQQSMLRWAVGEEDSSQPVKNPTPKPKTKGGRHRRPKEEDGQA